MWWELHIGHLMHYPDICLEAQEPYHAFVCTASLQAKIRTRDLWNTKSEYWRLRSVTTSVSVEWERIGKEVEMKYITWNRSENMKDVQWRMFHMTGNLNDKSAQCWRSSFILLKYQQFFNTVPDHEFKIISSSYKLGSCIRNQSQPFPLPRDYGMCPNWSNSSVHSEIVMKTLSMRCNK